MTTWRRFWRWLRHLWFRFLMWRLERRVRKLRDNIAAPLLPILERAAREFQEAMRDAAPIDLGAPR